MSITAMFAYNMASEGGKALADALSIPRIKHTGSKFVGASSKTILNWGATTDRFSAQSASWMNCRLLNPPARVDVAVDKVRAFEAFRAGNVSIPEFTTDKNTAKAWCEAGSMVFARTQLRAHSGRGIVIMDPDFPETFENQSAPLFVKYIPKKDEYRVHVLRGNVIDVQRKGLKAELKGTEGVNFKIRNLANGFVYTRFDNNNIPLIDSPRVPTAVKTVGIAAVNALGLDFGAADIIFNEKSGQAYCLEVNTAPGLTGTTVENYANAMAAL